MGHTPEQRLREQPWRISTQRRTGTQLQLAAETHTDSSHKAKTETLDSS